MMTITAMGVLAAGMGVGPVVSLDLLLDEMADRNAIARFPAWRLEQASSYNRESVKRGEPGWFADSDGVGFIRKEEHALAGSGTRAEWVAFEAEGPGAIVRMWAPYFYYQIWDRAGPMVRVYVDGGKEPVLEARWIELLTNNAWRAGYGPAPAVENSFHVAKPLARFTARAGDLYLPIPYAAGCKVTFDKPPFYNVINARSYPRGTVVESFTMQGLRAAEGRIARLESELEEPPHHWAMPQLRLLAPGASRRVELPAGSRCVAGFTAAVDPAEVAANPGVLRSLVVRMEFDGEETVWCPLGDLFGSPNALNTFATRRRTVTASGVMRSWWPMPYQKSGAVWVENVGKVPASVHLSVGEAGPWVWDASSLHFGARWRPDDIQPGDRFSDWNFIDLRGRGVLAGDQWTVLNATTGWWGEGDEKIYVDRSWDRGFPDCFGTGTEDYYGWAGGVNPTWADVFSHPFLANIAVGSASGATAARGGGSTRGFNICTRERGLDAVPFGERLVFDMEASPGVDQRGPKDRLGYSSVVFFYARPGAATNRPGDAAAAGRPIMELPR